MDPELPDTHALPAPQGPTNLPGVTAVYQPDIRVAEPETDLAATTAAMRFEWTRIGGHSGLSFNRCLRCRALIEARLKEQELHTQWHAAIGDPLPSPEPQHGWGAPA